MAEQQAVAPRGHKVLTVVGDSFTPEGHRVATYITAKFKERVSASGTTWRHVDQEMKLFYYNKFVKRYTWVDGQEDQFKATWNTYCAKLYRDHMYYMRKKGTRPAYVSEAICSAWTTAWATERWQANAEKAKANRNTEPGGPSTGTARHTSGSRSIVEHTIDLERELARQPTCMEIFLKTHKKKDGSFVDSRSQTLHQEMTERVAQASQPSAVGGESQSLSTDDLNEIYYDVVGGRTKNSTLYGLGSQAKVAFDRLRNPVGCASSSSSGEMQSLRRENQELRSQLKSMDQRMADMDQWRADEEKKRAERDKSNEDLMAQMRAIVASFTQASQGSESQETQDPSDGGR
ncbi:uncharacterized protein LOC122010436 [Zingiber officinale]|uniref:uncharacterized protein LOC122010436 n=1 Tax=Zingiber officinale TaxID=94328 RepID=UPI001C4B6DB9|nr:uncharacterized protein LOC122010436 [Zingiber officinale]